MTDLYMTALEVQRLCQGQRWTFCIIGGIAVQRWGEARFTKDVDLTLFTGFGEEELYLEVWLRHFHNHLDLRLVRKELRPLADLKEEPGINARFEEKVIRQNQPFTLINRTKPRKKRR